MWVNTRYSPILRIHPQKALSAVAMVSQVEHPTWRVLYTYIYTIYTHIDCTSHILQTVAYKTTTILLEGKRVKLQIWDTSGQGRFCTIIRSYSRGAQGIILVYDITNKWSFDGIDRWLKEVEEVSSRSTKDTQTGYKRNFGSTRFTRSLDALGSKVSFAYCDLNQFLLIVSL